MGRSAERPPGYHLSTPTLIPPRVGEQETRDDQGPDRPIGARVPNLSAGVYQGFDLLGENAGTQSEIHTGSSTQGRVIVQPKTEVPTANKLSLHCRMCEAPPTVTTQLTATTCGHLFCSEYVPRMLDRTTCRLTPRQVHNKTCSIHVQMSRMQQYPLVVLFV